MEKGIVAGFPLVDLKVAVYDGSYHDVDSSEMAFKIAGSMAFQDGAKRANPTLLEPIMKVEITTPFRYGKKEHSGITRLPIDVANWMVNKRFGKRL